MTEFLNFPKQPAAQLSLDLGDTQAAMVNHINCKVASLQKQKEDIIVSMANDCVRHYNRIFGNPAVGS